MFSNIISFHKYINHSKHKILINKNYRNYLVLREVFVKVIPSYQFRLTCSLYHF